MAASIDDTPSVLLVDDRPENLLALAAVLEPLHVHLRPAGSGEEALKALLEEDFAVVLLDVQMPGMDGFETAKFIRGRERSRTTPIIFLTAVSTDIAQVTRGYQAGAVDYVLKPFEPNMLRSKVSVFCDLERQRRARARADEMLLLAWRSLPTGAALIDGEGRVLRANPVLQKLTGGRAVNGVAVSTLVNLDDRLALDALLTAALAGATVPPAAELQLAGDEDLPVSILAWGVREHDGEILSVLIQVDDLRERRRAEAARERLAEERAGRAKAEAAYERERTIASTLQRDLLPRRLPDAPGVALASHFSAGGEGTAVGGDWFDAFTLPGGRLGLVIGDVAGRGVAAAARMGQLRSVARAYAVEGHTPSGVVARLNLYHQALRADDMTTLIYAVIEPDHGRLRLVNAGHPPPGARRPRLVGPAAGGLLPGPGHRRDLPATRDRGRLPARRHPRPLHRRPGRAPPGEHRLRPRPRLLSALAGAPGDIEAVRDDVIEACLGPERVDDDVTALFVRAEDVLGENIRLTLTPDADALAALRRMLRRWLIEMGAAPDEMGAIVMAANEAWQNAIEHGHDFQPVPVNVRFQREEDEVIVTVRDAGGRGQPAGDPDRGRGIELMRGLMDHAKLDLGSHRGGIVVLRRRIGVLAPVEPGGRCGDAAA